MNIIAGRFRGRKLKAPRGLDTRPVQARIREAVFNQLGDPDGLRFLDLFAGTGAMGIEAISRGAESAVFVDSANIPCRIIADNLATVGRDDRVLRLSARRALERFRAANETFHIVFADPPYDRGLSLETLADIGGGVLEAGGLFLVTTRATEVLPESSGILVRIRERKYGGTLFSVYGEEGGDEKADLTTDEHR